MIWPAYSAAAGQLDLWLTDVLWQTQRQSAGFASIVATFFSFDPVLLLLGTAGFVYAAVRKDISILLWIAPFVAFLSIIGYVQYFYWIPVLPVFCIAAARLIDRAAAIKQILPFAAIAGLTIFGLVFTTLLITADVTSAQFEATAFVAGRADRETTIASSPIYSWIFIYVFGNEHAFIDYRGLLFYPVETKEMLLVLDRHFQSNVGAGSQLRHAYDNTATIATFTGNVYNYDLRQYPYTSMKVNYEGSNIEIRMSN
jgi:hypothetical protein